MMLINGHIIIQHQTVAQLFENAAQVNWVYYAQKGTMLIASQHDELFKSLHKTNMSMLKYKNAEGDRSVSIQELLLDNSDILSADRKLDFKADEKMKILTVILK